MKIDAKKADELRAEVAQLLCVSEEEITNSMLDAGLDYLRDFLGEGDVQSFAAIPEYWSWFRLMWLNADLHFVNAMKRKPGLLTGIKKHGVGLETYAKHHWYEMKEKRPVSSVLSLFLGVEKPQKTLNTALIKKR